MQKQYIENQPKDIIVKAHTSSIIIGLIKYMLFPVFITTYLLASNSEREVFLGLERIDIFLIPANVFCIWFLYSFFKHVWKMEKVGGNYILIDKIGVYDFFNKRKFKWKEISSLRISHIPSAFYFGYDSFVINIILNHSKNSKNARCIRKSIFWRLDATDVDKFDLLASAERWHKEAVSHSKTDEE